MKDSIKNTRVLVTGGAGFIGANFVLDWIKFLPASDVECQ